MSEVTTASPPNQAGAAYPDRAGTGPKRNDNSSQDIHRSLPHSLEAEQGLLGSILISQRELLGNCVEQIDSTAFHFPAHQVMYDVLVELWNESKPIDFITLKQELEDRNLLDKVGGAAFITHLFTYTPTAANAPYYLEILQEKATLRKIITTCTDCAARGYGQEDPSTLLDEVEQRIFEISDARVRSGVLPMKEAVLQAMTSIEKLYQSKGEMVGLPTGFIKLDEMTTGLHPGEMFVIAARPSMGKTALAMNIAEHVALDLGQGVGVFSLEMTATQLVERLLCSIARVNPKKVRDGFMPHQQFTQLTAAASRLATCPMYIDDTPSISVLELRAKARRMKSSNDIQLIVIDYLQLLRSPSRRAQDNRQLEIAEISAGIKALAKELQIPIIVLAQLNRQPDARGGGRPKMSDLRESGSIEQDADLIGLLVRPEVYADDDEEKSARAGEAELIIAKQRNGPIGDVKLTFLKEFTRFETRADREEEG